MNTHAVAVDEEGLRAALEAEAGAPGPGETRPGSSEFHQGEALEPDPLAWISEARLLASFLTHKITPGWQVPPDVQEQWAVALSGCLGRMLPGGLGGVEGWGPWGKLAYASAAWGMAGFDMEKFKFKPLFPPASSGPIDGKATHENSEPPKAGGFSTMG